MIYLYTGPVQSGKTTLIMKALDGAKTIGGFLTPDQDGLRKIYFPSGNEYLNFQLDDASENEPTDHRDDFDAKLVEVGKFKFIAHTFEIAKQRTLKEAKSSDFEYILLDEIGKLELKQKGFHVLLTELLQLSWTEKHLILFVRDYLLQEVIKNYSLEDASVINKENVKDIL